MPFDSLTPEQMLEKYEDDLSRLKAQRAGLDKAIIKATAKIEAGREILGKLKQIKPLRAGEMIKQ